jgi:hypothetical protein
MKKALTLIALVAAPLALAKSTTTTIKIVQDNVTQQIADKHRHEQLGVNMNAVIGDEQVLLMCTDRKNCETLKPGEYEAKVHGKKVDVSYQEPVTRKSKKEHFVISGSW